MFLALASVLCFGARSAPWWTLRFVGANTDEDSLTVGIGDLWLGPVLMLSALALLASVVAMSVFVTPPRYEAWIAKGAMSLGSLLVFAALLCFLVPDQVIHLSEQVATTGPHLGPALTLTAGIATFVVGVRASRSLGREAKD